MANTAATVTFYVPEPPRPNLPGEADLQRFRVQVRRDGTGAQPLVNMYLDDDGVQIAQLLTDEPITSTDLVDGEVMSATWDAGDLTNVSGELVECRIEITEVSGVSGEIGAVSWDFTGLMVTHHRVGVRAYTDIPDKSPQGFDEKTGADTLVPLLDEGTTDFEIDTTDLLGVRVGELKFLTKILPVRTDTLVPRITETRDLDYGTPADIPDTESLVPVITESVDLRAIVAGTDTLVPVLTEDPGTVDDLSPTDKTGSDTITPVVTESSFVDSTDAEVFKAASDTLTPRITETRVGPNSYGEVDRIDVTIRTYGTIKHSWV